jgi:sugar lactone lactonase YvrE
MVTHPSPHIELPVTSMNASKSEGLVASKSRQEHRCEPALSLGTELRFSAPVTSSPSNRPNHAPSVPEPRTLLTQKTFARRSPAWHCRRPAGLFLLCCALAVGCGVDPGKRNSVVAAGAPLVPASAIETVLELEAPPGNVTVAPDGRVFFTFHPAAKPTLHVAEVKPEGGFEPFPDASWQAPRDDAPYFVSPLSLRADRKGRLWVLDHGDFGSETPSLTAFDISSRAVVHRLELPSDVANWGSMLNDFWVDAEREVVYIADTSAYDFDPALVVYDIVSGRARRVLEDHASMKAEDHHMVVQGRFMTVLGMALQVAVDSIALSVDGKTLYYGPMTGSRMYRIDTASLRDPTLDDAALAARVQEHGRKPATDGIAADAAGNLYLTAIEHDAIWVMKPDGGSRVLARDAELLSWPDGVHVSAGGRFLYVSVSELQHVLGADLDLLPEQRPFRILRIPLAEDP